MCGLVKIVRVTREGNINNGPVAVTLDALNVCEEVVWAAVQVMPQELIETEVTVATGAGA